MKRKVLVAALLAVSVLAFGASTWEGSAIISDGVTFPTDGLFGACNSFPVNSSVEVQNLENGKKVTVTITATVDNPAVFMALSPMAASALGMKAGASARVRVLAPSAASATPAPSSSQAAPSAKAGETNDPDYNPRALAAITANPYDASALAAPQDFMSLLGAGFPSRGVAESPEAPAATTGTPETPASASVQPTDGKLETARLLEATGAAGQVPASSAAQTPLAAPQNPPVPETSATAAMAPTTASPAAVLEAPLVAGKSPEAVPASAGAIQAPEASPLALSAPASAAKAALASPQPTSPESLSDETVAASASPLAETALATPEAKETTVAAESGAAAGAAKEPETSDAFPSAPASGTEAELRDAEARMPEFYALEAPDRVAPESPVLALADPEAGDGKPAAAVEAAETEAGPSLSDIASSSPSGAVVAGAMPDPALGPDLLPEALLDRLSNPEPTRPSVALADCDVELSGFETPETLAAGGPGPMASPVRATELADATAPAIPEKTQAAAVPQPPAPGDTIATLTPTAPQPPKASASAAAPSAEAAPPAAPAAAPSAPVSIAAIPKGTPAHEPTDVRMLEGMAKGSYYVQIGLFGSEEALRQAIKAVGGQFPILYERVDAGKGRILFRLYVGPIKRDESGIVLTKVKALGYKDAVLKQG